MVRLIRLILRLTSKFLSVKVDITYFSEYPLMIKGMENFIEGFLPTLIYPKTSCQSHKCPCLVAGTA